MAQSWQDQLAAEAEAQLAADEGAEDVTRYPLGNTAAGETVRAFVFLDNLEGTNQESGDGAVTHDEFGDRERRTGHLEISADVAVDDRDTWLVRGELWSTQRPDGMDGGMQGIRITRALGRETRLPRLRSSGLPRGR